ncbi:MAG: nucleotidyltransferase [Nocardioides sp.]|nr:nucleotidyltransferase [Nocardioides sp.]
MDRPPPEDTARRLVAERFPNARAAWLSGSVVMGSATATSDLDVTVVLPDVAVHRESLEYDGWPVELFVHTVASVWHFVALDLASRRPSMARLVATGVVLVDADGTAADLAAECADTLAAGPAPLSGSELDAMRYGLSDLLDDLDGGGAPEVLGAVAVATWQQAAELLLAVEGRWSGTGKWLVRELAAYDAQSGSAYAVRLQEGLAGAVCGRAEPLRSVATEILDRAGGRLWAGYRADAVL